MPDASWMIKFILYLNPASKLLGFAYGKKFPMYTVVHRHSYQKLFSLANVQLAANREYVMNNFSDEMR